MHLTKRQIRNFNNKVAKSSDCWAWTGYRLNGYGRVNVSGVCYLAHRVSAFLDGKIDTLHNKERGSRGMIIMHTCDNRACVRPDHLVVGTQKENLVDARDKGRKWYGEQAGERNVKAKLTKENVDFIRRSDKGPTELGRLFDVNRTTIYRILSGKGWVTA